LVNALRLVNTTAAGDLRGYTGEKTFSHYLDVGDNVHANVCSWLDVNCGDSENRWFIPGQCADHGHRYAKMIFCGKEWCPVCGKKYSPAHNRRFVRWFTKIRQFETMRYFVFTIPPQLRYKYRTKESLKEFGRLVQTLLIKWGYKRGLRRWHWFGDPPGQKNPNKRMVWSPHLNVLVEGGYIHEKTLETMHDDYDKLIGFKNADFKVLYKRTTPEKIDGLFYVTRATFLEYSWDLDMALELRNFRNMVVWGRDWKQEYKWNADPKERLNTAGESLDIYSIEKLLEHTCPRCNGQLVWGKALPDRLLQLTDTADLGAGFKVILDRDQPAHLKDQDVDRLALLRLIKHAKLMGAVIDKPEQEKKKKAYWVYNPLKPGSKELKYF